MTLVDDHTLSQYIDGSLDYQRSCEVADKIAHDRPTADMMGELLKVHVLLKSLGNEHLSEKIPEQILESLNYRKRNRRRKFFFEKPYFQIAASVVLILSGVAFGYLGKSNSYDSASFFPHIPAGLEKTVNDVLEDQKSGSVQDWVDEPNNLSARIWPVKTFRDPSGGYYRIYYVDLDQDGASRHFAGVAYRKGKNEWQTQSVFVRENADKI
jgi:hypothetical protein